MSEPDQTEAEEIIAALERIGLNALSNVQVTRAEIEYAGKDPLRNGTHKAFIAKLNTIAEGLAAALWIHRWYGKEVPRGTEGPAAYQGIAHLNELQAKGGKT